MPTPTRADRKVIRKRFEILEKLIKSSNKELISEKVDEILFELELFGFPESSSFYDRLNRYTGNSEPEEKKIEISNKPTRDYLSLDLRKYYGYFHGNNISIGVEGDKLDYTERFIGKENSSLDVTWRLNLGGRVQGISYVCSPIKYRGEIIEFLEKPEGDWRNAKFICGQIPTELMDGVKEIENEDYPNIIFSKLFRRMHSKCTHIIKDLYRNKVDDSDSGKQLPLSDLIQDWVGLHIFWNAGSLYPHINLVNLDVFSLKYVRYQGDNSLKEFVKNLGR